jgi:hypothetical protein
MKRFFMLSLSILSLSSLAYNGEITFSADQVEYHESKIKRLAKTSEDCLQRHKKEHIDFYKKNCRSKWNGKKVCLSKFYGERRYTMKKGSRRSDGKKLEYLPDALKDAGFSKDYARQMRTTSCVGLALQCLKEGFQKTNQSDVWEKVMRFVRANGVGGTALQHALAGLGWTTYYWNPSAPEDLAANAARWDEEEKRWQSKGWHLYRYQRIQNRGTYWFNNVDDAYAMVGFGKGSPRRLRRVPFWVGTAHTGYHVFPGTKNDVVEAHSTRHITAFDNFEFSKFAPFATGGGPRWTKTEKYRSGLIVIPPTY